MRSQWGRYNLPRYGNKWVLTHPLPLIFVITRPISNETGQYLVAWNHETLGSKKEFTIPDTWLQWWIFLGAALKEKWKKWVENNQSWSLWNIRLATSWHDLIEMHRVPGATSVLGPDPRRWRFCMWLHDWSHKNIFMECILAISIMDGL